MKRNRLYNIHCKDRLDGHQIVFYSTFPPPLPLRLIVHVGEVFFSLYLPTHLPAHVELAYARGSVRRDLRVTFCYCAELINTNMNINSSPTLPSYPPTSYVIGPVDVRSYLYEQPHQLEATHL